MNTPKLVCPKCQYNLSFLLQLYANIDSPQFYDYHRTIYVFLCVSEQCIATSSAVKVFTCLVPHKNKLGIKFIEDDSVFDKIMKKTDNQLRAMGYQIPTKKVTEEDKNREQEEDSADAKKKKNQEALDKYYKRQKDEEDDDDWEDLSDGDVETGGKDEIDGNQIMEKEEKEERS